MENHSNDMGRTASSCQRQPLSPAPPLQEINSNIWRTNSILESETSKTGVSNGIKKLQATFSSLQEQLGGMQSHVSRREHSHILQQHLHTNGLEEIAKLPVQSNCALTSDSLLGTGRGGGPESLFDFSSETKAGKDSLVHKCAVEVFHDNELLDLCDDGLNKQLQRTKDGATEQSRIQELAGLVKLLRKCIRELASRASMYVDQCIKLEKDLLKQVKGVQLQSESTVKSLEAELAGAKKDLAQYEATFKMDKAKWGADLEDQKYEMMRLKRELDRLTEERDRAREESKKAEQARQQLEIDLKELRKQSTQQIREVSMNQNEAVQRMTEAAEKREVTLKATDEEKKRLSKRLDAAKQCIDALQGELSMFQQLHKQTQDALKAKTSEEECLSVQAVQLQAELDSTKQQLSDITFQRDELSVKLLESQHGREQAEISSRDNVMRAETLEVQVNELVAVLELERKQWSESQQQLMAAQHQICERETALIEEKGLLKTAVTAAISQKEMLETQLRNQLRENTALITESKNLRNQIDFITGNQQQAEMEVSDLSVKIDVLTSEAMATQEELKEKDARLQELEGEFSALKEVLGDSGQRDVVNSLLRKISTLQAAVASSDAQRRKLHNELVEVKGNIRVYCRIRPNSNNASSVRCMPDQCGLQITVDQKDHSMEFDRVYGPSSTQENVFSGVSELVQSALDGYHVCLFSYGQTGAGKTHTMQGHDDPAGRGIIPRAVEKILQTAQQLQDQEWEYTMEASFIEIYNNQLRDLLGGQSAPYISDQNAIKHDLAGGHTTVVGISKVPVKDVTTASVLIQRAAAARSCEATAMNSTSSRSHSIFMLYITGAHPPSETQLQGCLCLVDLAGSERLDRSQAEGQRKAEACAINQSLSSIGDVFAALSAKAQHIPYRNSKLTYLLQPCLGGNGKTLMLVNINPEPASAYESLCSLKFAAKVNGCETAARGGARRNAVGPSVLASASDPNDGDSKRLSLPGFPKTGSLPDPLAKRMSLAMPMRQVAPGTMPSAGAKRGNSGLGSLCGIPPTNGAKRLKPS